MTLPSMVEILRTPEIFRQGPFRMGLWRGEVVSTADPQRRGRVQVRIHQLHPVPGEQGVPAPGVDPSTGFRSLLSDDQVQGINTSTTGGFNDAPNVQVGPNTVAPPKQGISNAALPWAEPCFPFGGRRRTMQTPSPPNKEPGPDGNLTEGFFAIPTVGSTVWIAFENNFTGRPIYLGTWYGDKELPEELDGLDPSKLRLMKTPAGHLLLFDDTAGQERVFLGTYDKDDATTSSHLRFLELNDSTETLRLEQRSQDESEEQRLQFNLPAKVVELLNNASATQHLRMDRDGQTVELLHEDGADTLRILLDVGNQKLTIEYPPESIVVEPNRITITSGGNTVVLDGTSGSWTVTVTGAVTVNCVGHTVNCASYTNNATGAVSLGLGASQGVVLDSIIAVIAAAYAVFDTHTHLVSGSPIGGPFDPSGSFPVSMTPPILGTNSSSTVSAKL